MYADIHICTYVYTVCIYTYLCTYKHIRYIYIYIYIFIHTHAPMCVLMQGYAHSAAADIAKRMLALLMAS